MAGPASRINWDRVHVWTTTLYALIQSLHLARETQFGDLNALASKVQYAGQWLATDCSYRSVLLAHPFGKSCVTFRRDPNSHFQDIVGQVIQMLVQDLVVIFDGMMDEILLARGERAGIFPQSKVEKLATHLDVKYEWASHGCLELIAARNVLTHGGGRWNTKSIAMVKGFISPLPQGGERLVIGFPLL
jgi:hypothetical protein